MVRIAGIALPENKNIEIALTYIYGIGRSLSNRILAACHIHPHTKVKDLTGEQVDQIRHFIETHYQVEGDLRRKVLMDIKRLKEIKCYRGERHKRNLPVRGQRTRTNARTKRGKRVCVGSGRKKPPAPK